MFNDVIDAYKEVNRQRNLSLGRTQFGPGPQNTNVSWVFIEVPLKPRPDGSAPTADIIQFYNQVFLERMKAYILETKGMVLDQGSRTPVLNRSNMDALLTPGGRLQKPGIATMCPMTPLIDAVSRGPRLYHTIYSSTVSQHEG